MKINYFGHAAVGIETRSGVKVLLDPYKPGAFNGMIGYSEIPGRWDIVAISHEHLDHNHVSESFGNPVVMRSPGSALGVDVRMYHAKHGDNLGTVDAETRVLSLILDDVRIVHPGDLGEDPPMELCANLSGADVLFVPVGGRFTMGPKGAVQFISAVKPRLAIPIHYKTESCGLPLEPVDSFLAECPFPVRRLTTGSIELSSGALPARTEVWVLRPLCSAVRRSVGE